MIILSNNFIPRNTQVNFTGGKLIRKANDFAQIAPVKDSVDKISSAYNSLNGISVTRFVPPLLQPQKIYNADYIVKEMSLTNITKSLDNIFKIPVEQRNKKLSHEMLKSGNLFSGRFSYTTSDGTKVTISRVKSPKYVEFTYYSIKVQGKDNNFILNIDPECNKIIECTPEGKPLLDKRNKVRHVTKETFLKNNPGVVKLNQYLGEIFSL